jgi:xanthine dehydrogenase YagS FAD-binding subunit
MAGICCYRPDGSRARLCFHTQPGSYNDHTLIGVLKQLRRFLRGAPATQDSFRAAAEAELAGARTLPGNAFKVPLARNVIVSTLLELMEASR